MRKGMIIALVFIIAIFCSGCIVITIDEYYEIHQEVSQIDSIGIYACADGMTLSEEPIVELEQAQSEQFVNDIEALPFANKFLLVLAAVDPSFHFGDYVVRIAYQDGSTELISNSGYQEYRGADGSFYGPHYSIDDQLWLDFLQKYLDVAP